MVDEKVVKRENDKYLVIKTKDLDRFFSGGGTGRHVIISERRDIPEKILFSKIINGIREKREMEGKKDNRYIVCNEDEFYSEMLWRIILWGEGIKKEDCGVCPFCGKLPFECGRL